MSFPALRRARPAFHRSKSCCTKIWRPPEAFFSSSPARSTKSQVKVIQQNPLNASTKFHPIRHPTKLPVQNELPKFSNAQMVQNLQKQNLARYLYDSGETVLYQA